MMTKHPPLSVVSLFCGVGGLDLGFNWQGFNTVWANDNSGHATKSYAYNFGLEPICADVTDLPLRDIPPADVVIGGPPCQAFSLVGQRRVEDPRGKLVFRFFEVVQSTNPLAFVMENVPGMAASRINEERLPDILLREFENLGYSVTKMKLTATDYLVPQRRQRLILVGCKGWKPEIPDKVQFASECYGVDYASADISSVAAIGDLGECSPIGHRAKYRPIEPSWFAQLMRQQQLPNVSLHHAPRMSEMDRVLVSHIPPGGNYQDVPDEVAPGRLLKFKQTGGRTTTYGRLHPDMPSYTINTYFRRPNVGSNFHYAEPRLITPREAMRFQALPDHFELSYGSQDQRNALIGNAVPPLMARAIAWSVQNAIGKTPLRQQQLRMQIP